MPVRLSIYGMHCASCVAHVEKVLRRQPGVADAAVNLATESGLVHGAPGHALDAEALAAAVRAAGYMARVVDEPSGPDHHADAPPAMHGLAHDHAHGPPAGGGGADEARAWARRVVVALPCAAVVMALMFWTHPASAWIALGLTLVVQATAGLPFYRGAIIAARHGRADMDTLVSIGALAALGYSVWMLLGSGDAHGAHAGHDAASVHDSHALYFDSASMVLALVAMGKWLEARARRAAGKAIRGLGALVPDLVTREARGGAPERVARTALRAGDTLVTLPGERFAADGVLLGAMDTPPRAAGLPELTTADESMLSGESMPVPKRAGDRVLAGTLNLSAAARVRVERIGAGTMLDTIGALVADAQTRKARVQRLADRVSGVFVPIVMLIAVGVLLAHGLIGHDWARALQAAVSVLIVACPCALGLAVPAAVMVGTGVGARRGIVIKDPGALERAGRLRAIALDKTGTLTLGRPEVKEIVPVSVGIPTDEVLRNAAAVERLSTHPLAEAIVRLAERKGLPIPVAQGARTLPGHGATGAVEGVEIEVGRLHDDELRGPIKDAVEVMRAKTLTLVAVRERGAGSSVPTLRAVVGLRDQARPGARAALARLRSLGLRVVMLTGDHETAARAVATELGVDEVHAGVTPEGKVRAIRQLQQALGQGSVAMAGDGINDAPALAAADVGIAVASGGRGADIAAHAGHILLVSDDLDRLPEAIALSRAMMRRIRLGLAWAFVYNLALIPVAALGWLHPMLAALAMSLSSVSVVLNALWLRRWRPDWAERAG